MDENVQATPGTPVISAGDGRGFDATMTPEDNRVYVEVDYSTGSGFVEVSRSCKNSTKLDCKDANSLAGAFDSTTRGDGSVSFNFSIGNSLIEDTVGANNLEISANIDMIPISGGGVCVFGSASRFPAIEAYYDVAPNVFTIFREPQSDFGPIALAAPDRNLPPCETTEYPGWQPPVGEPA